MRTIPAADANREFSKLLRDVSEGETIVVTSRGKPVARISPVGEADLPGRDSARAALLMRLREQPAIGATWTRDELYEG
ncbi:MAG: prevent-host-death family protein [Rhodocyclaceae bacterium]|nr:MAG: prevent-host-death family protein [Rhodocyclaceae bacterium]